MHYDDKEMNEMRKQFLAQYEEPVVGTPVEGGNVYFHSNPYDALEVLSAKFDSKYPSDKINKVAKDLTLQSYDWVKRHEFYDTEPFK